MSTLSDDPHDYCFLDTETRALPGLLDPRWGDVTQSGVGRYARSSKVIMMQYAIGPDEPVDIWELKDFDQTLRWIDAPPNLLKFHARVLKGEAWYVAFNSGFDRNVCNHGMVATSKHPTIPVRCMLDAMAQVVASNLPSGLDRAHKAVGGKGKLAEGKELIQLFCTATGGTPQTHPDEWETFVDYGVDDVVALREVFLGTRPLTVTEWEQFWSSEVINDRGLPIDRAYVERGAYLAELYMQEVDERVKEFTHYDRKKNTGLRTVNQHVAMAQYVYDALEHLPDATAILTKRYEEDNEGTLVPAKVSVERRRVEKLLPLLERLDKEQGLTDEEFDILQLLEVREYGASATPKKFAKMLPMLTAQDRLPGQYVFNGAQQTGRFSSRGVQVHNLTRKALPNEAEAIDAILDIELPDDADIAQTPPAEPAPNASNMRWIAWHTEMASYVDDDEERDRHLAEIAELSKVNTNKTRAASRKHTAEEKALLLSYMPRKEAEGLSFREIAVATGYDQGDVGKLYKKWLAGEWS